MRCLIVLLLLVVLVVIVVVAFGVFLFLLHIFVVVLVLVVCLLLRSLFCDAAADSLRTVVRSNHIPSATPVAAPERRGRRRRRHRRRRRRRARRRIAGRLPERPRRLRRRRLRLQEASECQVRAATRCGRKGPGDLLHGLQRRAAVRPELLGHLRGNQGPEQAPERRPHVPVRSDGHATPGAKQGAATCQQEAESPGGAAAGQARHHLPRRGMRV